MGDFSASDCSWKKMVIAKSNNKWKTTMKSEQNAPENNMDTRNLSFDEGFIPLSDIKKENIRDELEEDIYVQNEEPEEMVQVLDPLIIETPLKRTRNKRPGKDESAEERAARLAKMSAYAARRLANETAEQRANRLRRMSEYAAKRLASESTEQRARRLSRMSAYAAQRLAKESPEQRQARLARMSAYAARRQAQKKTVTPPQSMDPNQAQLNNIISHLRNKS